MISRIIQQKAQNTHWLHYRGGIGKHRQTQKLAQYTSTQPLFGPLTNLELMALRGIVAGSYCFLGYIEVLADSAVALIYKQKHSRQVIYRFRCLNHPAHRVIIYFLFFN